MGQALNDDILFEGGEGGLNYDKQIGSFHRTSPLCAY